MTPHNHLAILPDTKWNFYNFSEKQRKQGKISLARTTLVQQVQINSGSLQKKWFLI